MLGPANQYLIFFSPFGERLGLNTAGCSEKQLESSGSRSGVSCRSVGGGAGSYFCLLNGFLGWVWGFCGLSFVGQVQGSLLETLDLCREDAKESSSGSSASLSSAHPTKLSFKMHFSLSPCSFLAAASHILPLPLCFPAFWKALRCVSSLNLYFCAADCVPLHFIKFLSENDEKNLEMCFLFRMEENNWSLCSSYLRVSYKVVFFFLILL